MLDLNVMNETFYVVEWLFLQIELWWSRIFIDNFFFFFLKSRIDIFIP